MSDKHKCHMCGQDAPHYSLDAQEICRRAFNKWQYEMDRKNEELYWALRTRVLTPEEMEEVKRQDYSLLVRTGQSFREAEIRKIFNDALLQQFMIRLAQEKADSQVKA